MKFGSKNERFWEVKSCQNVELSKNSRFLRFSKKSKIGAKMTTQSHPKWCKMAHRSDQGLTIRPPGRFLARSEKV